MRYWFGFQPKNISSTLTVFIQLLIIRRPNSKLKNLEWKLILQCIVETGGNQFPYVNCWMRSSWVGWHELILHSKTQSNQLSMFLENGKDVVVISQLENLLLRNKKSWIWHMAQIYNTFIIYRNHNILHL